VLGHLSISGIEIRFVAARVGDGGQKVIRDEDFRDPLKEFKGMDMRLNPGGKSLRKGGFCEGIITGS
jgi:hypothetical protein